MTYDATLLIQARMESSRLFGKVMKPLNGKPLIQTLIERMQTIACDKLIVSISNDPASLPIQTLLDSLGLSYYAGDPLNVYKRFADTINSYSVKTKAIVRVTADNPLTDTQSIEKGIEKLEEENLDYLWIKEIPKGLGCDIFRTETFLSFQNAYLLPSEKEHIIPIFLNRPGLKGGFIPSRFPQKASALSFTVDTQSDYENISQIFKLYNQEEILDLNRIVTESLIYKSSLPFGI